MTEHDDQEIQRLLKEVFPPMDRQLRRDLWPTMLGRLPVPRIALAWCDWALIAALCGWVVFYPQGILQLVYHL